MTELKIFRSKFQSRRAQLKLYQTLIRLVLIYGSEVWTMTTEERNALWIFENKILRKIYGSVREEGRWRIRNKEGDREDVTWERFRKIYKIPLIWYGNFERTRNWRIYRTLCLPYDFIWSLYIDKFKLAELTKEREHCKFIPGLFVVGLNI
jgi:hypothetical protein